MFRTIVWATDGSEAADRALPYAKELARDGGTLVAVHCKEELVGRAAGYPILANEPELLEKIERQVEETRDEGVKITLRVVAAPANATAHVVADAARELAADAIVVGTRGHAPVAGLLVGSVTQRLLHIAPCPVLAVPAGKHAEPRQPELEASAH